MARRTSRCRATTLVELLVVLTILGTLVAIGAARMTASVSRLKQVAEAERLVGCLRWMRDMARGLGPESSIGYGVFFWRNPRSSTCFQYSPYIPRVADVPDHPSNAATQLLAMGFPGYPITLGLRAPVETASLDISAEPLLLSDGMEIVFQTDAVGQPDRYPDAVGRYPDRPFPPGSWNRSRVLFWPAGATAPAFWSGGQPERGTTFPRFGGVDYNRVYIRSVADDPLDARSPLRIRIDPGTGYAYIMRNTELWEDRSW